MSRSNRLQNRQQDCDRISKRPRIEDERSIEKFTFNWLLEGFVESTAEFESELFTPFSTIPVKFRIQARRDSAVSVDWGEGNPYEFYLLKCSGETIPGDMKVQCEIELRFGHGNKFCVKKETCDLRDQILLFVGYYHPQIDGRRSTNFKVGAQSLAIRDNFMDLLFNFKFFSVHLNALASNINTCLADLKCLYDSKEMSDVSIRVGKDVFKAHKLVLAARSPVFKAMFTHKLVEEQTNCVDIKEKFNPCSVDCFLRYLYCGDMGSSLGFDTISQIFSLASKYQVADLSKHCSYIMAVELSQENALEIVVLADLHNDAQLKEKAIALIFQHLQQIVQQQNWKDFFEKYPNLSKEILRLS